MIIGHKYRYSVCSLRVCSLLVIMILVAGCWHQPCFPRTFAETSLTSTSSGGSSLAVVRVGTTGRSRRTGRLVWEVTLTHAKTRTTCFGQQNASKQPGLLSQGPRSPCIDRESGVCCLGAGFQLDDPHVIKVEKPGECVPTW